MAALLRWGMMKMESIKSLHLKNLELKCQKNQAVSYFLVVKLKLLEDLMNTWKERYMHFLYLIFTTFLVLAWDPPPQLL